MDALQVGRRRPHIAEIYPDEARQGLLPRLRMATADPRGIARWRIARGRRRRCGVRRVVGMACREFGRMRTGWKMALRWYVVEAVQGKDGQAADGLRDEGFEVCHPMDVVYLAARRARSRRVMYHHYGAEPRVGLRAKRWVSRFGRFFFVRVAMDDAARDRIVKVASKGGSPLVRRLLCYAGSNEPCVIRDEDVLFFATDKQERGACAPIIFNVGETVEILSGPFVTFEGVVEMVDKRGWLIVALSVFGRATPIRIKAAHVRRSEMCSTQSPPRRTSKDAPRMAQSA